MVNRHPDKALVSGAFSIKGSLYRAGFNGINITGVGCWRHTSQILKFILEQNLKQLLPAAYLLLPAEQQQILWVSGICLLEITALGLSASELIKLARAFSSSNDSTALNASQQYLAPCLATLYLFIYS